MHHFPRSSKGFPPPKWAISPAKVVPFPPSSTPVPPAKKSTIKSIMPIENLVGTSLPNPPGHGFNILLYIKYMFFSTFFAIFSAILILKIARLRLRLRLRIVRLRLRLRLRKAWRTPAARGSFY
jgi:hypothetical protein